MLISKKTLGTTEPYPTWGDVCGSDVSKYSWNDELVVYKIHRYSTNPYDDDEWSVDGKYNLVCHISLILRLSGLY